MNKLNKLDDYRNLNKLDDYRNINKFENININEELNNLKYLTNLNNNLIKENLEILQKKSLILEGILKNINNIKIHSNNLENKFENKYNCNKLDIITNSSEINNLTKKAVKHIEITNKYVNNLDENVSEYLEDNKMFKKRINYLENTINIISYAGVGILLMIFVILIKLNE